MLNQPGTGSRIVLRVVRRRPRAGEAAPVQRDPQVLEPMASRPAGWRTRRRRRGQGSAWSRRFRRRGCRAERRSERPRAASRASCRLKNRAIEASRQSPSNTSPCDHDERGLLFERPGHEALESFPARPGEARRDVAVLLREAEKRTAEVQVGGVNELESHVGMVNDAVPRTKSELAGIHRKSRCRRPPP